MLINCSWHQPTDSVINQRINEIPTVLFSFAPPMNRATKKIISIFLLVIFLSGSGAGQLIHSIFHKHPVLSSVKSSVSVSTPRTFCNAMQLTLPEFSESISCSVPTADVSLNSFCERLQPSITSHYSFKTSDRAPPVLA